MKGSKKAANGFKNVLLYTFLLKRNFTKKRHFKI